MLVRPWWCVRSRGSKFWTPAFLRLSVEFIILPFPRIVYDIFRNPPIRLFVPDDVFVIIALPNLVDIGMGSEIICHPDFISGNNWAINRGSKFWTPTIGMDPCHRIYHSPMPQDCLWYIPKSAGTIVRLWWCVRGKGFKILNPYDRDETG